MTVKITIKDHASIQVEGDFEISDQAGDKFDLAEKKTVWLCRCGQSKKKPFCDGSHKAAGFQSELKAK